MGRKGRREKIEVEEGKERDDVSSLREEELPLPSKRRRKKKGRLQHEEKKGKELPIYPGKK